MPKTLLTDFPFKISYGASDDRLHDFYIPALSASVRFDRATGFFSSASLAIAAAGLVRLIENDGQMRLLCGAQLSVDDVEAVKKGSDLRGIVSEAMQGCLADPQDQSQKARLEALAWMVAHGKLEIRVVLPKGKNGLPLAASEAREYYHPKEALFEDREGNKLAFQGSSNESENSWQWNYEVFSVYASWSRMEGADEIPPLLPYVRGVERRFNNLWDGKEEDWISLDIPTAVKDRLLKYTPKSQPRFDPLEKRPDAPVAEVIEPIAPPVEVSQEEKLLFKFIREAPFLPNATRLGIETSAVSPWPHQSRVAMESVKRYPENFLFCDEVGLGKTIEAGLALRQLIISKRVQRALILVPKSVLRQWQEELYEKFVLNIPRYEDGEVRDVFGTLQQWNGANVWNSFPFLMASSQLAKMQNRQLELVQSDPWDLIIVDESHHARRKDFLDPRFRPNRLLELLLGAGNRQGLKDRTKSTYLLTATPMQVHPVEVWDLLKVLGLGGRWGADSDNFLDFFIELRKGFDDRKWGFILTMVRDYLESGGSLDPTFCQKAEDELSFVEADSIKGLPFSSKPNPTIKGLSKKGKAFLETLARKHTPLEKFVWRHTRTLLRKYKEQGLLDGTIPYRDPKPVWITLLEKEKELYERIETYICDFYQKYEAERKGLGFVMTVYRRRLTSSFFAIERSLQRRLNFLKGVPTDSGLFTEDDVEQEDLDFDFSEEFTDEKLAQFQDEIDYVEDFLHDLKTLGSDSKLDQLQEDIRKILTQRDTILLFTQYTDTMDYLRDQLRQVYGSQIACYSGRGGEKWDGVTWIGCSKEEIKEAFRQGEDVKILIGTESASEGLNLQTCGVLINYDMPWNPMRVEQRIGRIDRIGQKFDRVWIRNYFYEDTVEAKVYQRLEDRIQWFENVVGELQPILYSVASAIQKLVMSPGSERPRLLEDEIARIRRELDDAQTNTLNLDNHIPDEPIPDKKVVPAVTLTQIEEMLTKSAALGHRFEPHDEIDGAYWLHWYTEKIAVTFRPDVFDRHPNTVQMLTYGNPIFEELIESVDEPEGGGLPQGVAFCEIAKPIPVSLFVRLESDGLKPIQDFGTLKKLDQASLPFWSFDAEDQVTALIERTCQDVVTGIEHESESRHNAARLAFFEEARQVLIRAALVEVAKSSKADLFTEPTPYSPWTFGTEPVDALKRHGAPFKGLLALVRNDQLSASSTDPFMGQIENQSLENLNRKFEALKQTGFDILMKVQALNTSTRKALVLDRRTIKTSWYPRQPQEVGQVVQILDPSEAKPFENCVPLYDLRAAAGLFSEEQIVDEVPQSESLRDPSRCQWVRLNSTIKPSRDLFVAQVVGESMNRQIPNGSFCLFRLHPKGTRQGKTVLVQHQDIHDEDFGGQYTVKVYRSEKDQGVDGEWRHREIRLEPDSNEPSFQPIILTENESGDLRVIAELVAIFGGNAKPSDVR